jgi:hypothetical protein
MQTEWNEAAFRLV